MPTEVGAIRLVLVHQAVAAIAQWHVGGLQCGGLSSTTAGILGGEASAAVAAGINVMVWHETTVGICQLQVGCPDGVSESM